MGVPTPEQIQGVMAFCIPTLPDDAQSAVVVASQERFSDDNGGMLRRRCERYRRVVRYIRQQNAGRALAKVSQVIEAHEANIRATLEDSLAGLVLEAAEEIVRRVGGELPDAMAEGLAREAERFATTVLRGEREVVVRAHPEDRAIIGRRCGGFIGWRWEDDPRQPRGELSLNLTAGVIDIRWRNLVGGFSEASVLAKALSNGDENMGGVFDGDR